MPETLQQALRERLAQCPDRTAVRHGELSWTWREYLDEAAAEAAALAVLVDPSRPFHVGALLGNTPAMVRSMAAAAMHGHVVVGINDTRRGDGLAQDILRADCQVLLVDQQRISLLKELDLAGVRVIDIDGDEYAALVEAGPSAEEFTPYREVEALDTFMLIFTSGTSGEPKSVQVSHFMATFAGTALVERYALTPDDVIYISMPLFHSNSLMGGWAVSVAAGAAMVPTTFSASQFLTDLRRYGVTYLNYVGKPLAYVLATPEKPDDADNSLRVAFGNEASDRDIDEFARRFDCTVWDGYGSTETAIMILRQDGTPRGSIGKGMADVGIYNSETLTECAVAEFDEHGRLTNADEAVGELVNTQGSGYFVGYYNDVAANESRMWHGMYWSGDLAYRDADEWVYLAGRTADWMRVDGENLAAAPIERVLLRLENVNRVAVYAVPDESGIGDQVMAAIVMRDNTSLTPEELEVFLDEQRDLSPKARPRWVRVVPDLPTTATNKILKKELISQGVVAGDGGELWEREPQGKAYTRQ